MIPITIDPAPKVPQTDRLRQYSITDCADELRLMAQEQTPLLGNLCLKGQTTVLYAAPNVGKTLMCMALMQEAIEQGRLVGENTYYIAADDNPSGVLEKIELLKSYRVNVLAPGFRGFEVKNLADIMKRMADDRSAREKFIIMDTMKKCASLMDKGESSKFADLARGFVMKGGTFLGLAHTNKRPDKEGRPIPAGTSDILDDFDCGHTIMELSNRSSQSQKSIQFDCIKSRGDVAQQVAYRYDSSSSLTYAEKVESVQLIDTGELTDLQRGAQMQKDAEIITTVESCIRSGLGDGKMALAKAVSAQTGVGRHTVEAIIEKYTGDQTGVHLWRFEKGVRGKRGYVLLSNPEADEDEY